MWKLVDAYGRGLQVKCLMNKTLNEYHSFLHSRCICSHQVFHISIGLKNHFPFYVHMQMALIVNNISFPIFDTSFLLNGFGMKVFSQASNTSNVIENKKVVKSLGHCFSHSKHVKPLCKSTNRFEQ